MKTRYYSAYEHKADMEYEIVLNKNNKYYDTFFGSDVEGKTILFKTDSEGYIYPSKIYDNPDYKIFFLGDSSIECTFVLPEKRYPYLVGRILQQGDMKINSYNAGVSGADTLSMIRILVNKIMAERPDVVVLCNLKSELAALLSSESAKWNGNNSDKNTTFDSEWAYRESFIKRCKMALSLIFPFLKQRYAPLLAEMTADSGRKLSEEEIVKIIEGNYRSVIQLCKSRDIQVVIMTQANRYTISEEEIKNFYVKKEQEKTGIEYEDYIKLYKKANQLIRDICKKEEVHCIDLEKMVEDNMLYDEVHYNNYGSEKVAEIIAKELQYNVI